MGKNICVYCSSSCVVDREYFHIATELGRRIGRRGDTLVYGGGVVGLMGAVARGVHDAGGRVVGVIPEALNRAGIVYPGADELIVTRDMRERKAIMDKRSDAFIALPGGFGTLEEILEIITLKQLGYHNKPIVIMNVGGFYDCLIAQFDLSIEKRFAKEYCRQLYMIAEDVEETLLYIDSYEPLRFEEKWMTDEDV